MKRQAVQLSSKSVEHYGPPEYLELVRFVMGGIDLDPASCEAANQIVQATKFYTAKEDGLRQPWAGRVYLNPPGGRVEWEGRKHNSAALWWAHLAAQWEAGDVSEAVFMVFNLELFRYAQEYPVAHPLDFPICFPTERIDFWAPNPETGKVEPQGSPGHPNAIVYLGTTEGEDRFLSAFSSKGRIFGCR